jgi:hypothetical protein
MIDTLRADKVGAYNPKTNVQTPNYDAFAADATMFRWAQVPGTWSLPSQASMLTGTPPGVHGVIANGFYHRDRKEVEFWVGHNDVIVGEQIWDAIRQRGGGLTSAVWHAQNIIGAAAGFIVTPAPIHESDGKQTLVLFKPTVLSATARFMGAFLQHYWGPLSASVDQWILNTAVWLEHRRIFGFTFLISTTPPKIWPQQPLTGRQGTDHPWGIRSAASHTFRERCISSRASIVADVRAWCTRIAVARAGLLTVRRRSGIP